MVQHLASTTVTRFNSGSVQLSDLSYFDHMWKSVVQFDYQTLPVSSGRSGFLPLDTPEPVTGGLTGPLRGDSSVVGGRVMGYE